MNEREKYLLLEPLKKVNILSELKNCNATIAGGAITSIFTDNKINDYDIYFHRQIDYFKLSGIFKQKTNFKKIIETVNADTYKDKDYENNITIQLIKLDRMFIENITELINEFDFTICMGAYSFVNNEFILDENFIKHNSQRRLVYNINCKFPICALYRLKKYLKREYKVSGAEIIKLALSIHKLQIDNYHDLKEQLLGIDTFLLKELTDKLESDEYADKIYDYDEFIHFIDSYLEQYEDILS